MTKRSILSCLAFFFIPILGFASSFINICRRDVSKTDIFIISSFFFIIGYSVPPVYDLARHYSDFDSMVDFNSFYTLIEYKFDFILYTTEYVTKTLGLHFGIVPGAYSFISYYIILSIYRFYTLKSQKMTSSTYFLLSLLVLSTVPLFTIILGLRFGFGIFIALYASFLIFEKRNKIGYLFLILAMICHFAFLLLAIAFILSKLVRVSKSLFIVLIIVAISTSYLISNLINIMPVPELLKGRLLAYLTGYWATEFLDTYSLWYRVSLILTYWMIYPGVLYLFLINKNSYKDSYMQFTIWNILILFLFCNYEVIFSRYAMFVNCMIILQFIKHYSSSCFKNTFLLIFTFVGLITFAFGNIYANRTVISLNNMTNILYLPPVITIFERTQYDRKILSQIDEQGRFL
ncbi:EpsG family protein [Buttiauxella sp. S04-F03]|uniref:EpsG family protein n=1 Tax=Buttiauxella sp. S04-F03 TaxID=2904525 RepID=UPI00351D7B90